MMTAAIHAIGSPPKRDRTASVLQTARVALAVAGAAALYRVAVAVLSTLVDGPSKVRFLLFYGTIALVAVALRWGVDRRASVARWACVVAGLPMVAALIRGRGAFATFWHYFPVPVADVLLFLVWPLMIIGFVVAGACCALAQSDSARWR